MNRATILSRIKKAIPENEGLSSRSGGTEKLAHEVKNCMSILFLTLGSLKRDGEQWKLSGRQRQALEDTILEMNRIVDDMIQLARKRERLKQQEVSPRPQ